MTHVKEQLKSENSPILIGVVDASPNGEAESVALIKFIGEASNIPNLVLFEHYYCRSLFPALSIFRKLLINLWKYKNTEK